MTNLQAALKTLSEHLPQAHATATVKTSDDPEVRDRIESFSAARTNSEKVTIVQKQTRNFHTCSNEMGAVETRALLNANNARSMEEKNAVLSAELRRRGLAPFGEAKVITNLAVSHAPKPTPPQAPLSQPAAAVPAIVELSTGMATAVEFSRLSTNAREEFCREGGSLTRGEFSALKPAAASEFCRLGGTLVDDPGATDHRQRRSLETPAPAPKAGFDRLGRRLEFDQSGPPMNRTAFEALKPEDQANFCRNGGKLTD